MSPSSAPEAATPARSSDRPRGRFITFEGGEGAGKSSQVGRLAEHLRGLGHEVVVTREPGGSPGAEAIRHVLLSGVAEAFGPLAEAALFAAARADHLDQTIRPALEAGHWVVCDRFVDSSRVYQGLAGEVSADRLRELEAASVGADMPDLTLLLDVPVEIGLARATKRRGSNAVDRFERDEASVHERRRQAFLDLARAEPGRFVVVDAGQDPTTVAEAIWYAVRSRLAPAIRL